MNSKLIFDNNNFEVQEVYISGYISDPYWCDTYNYGRSKNLTWSISIKTSGKDISYIEDGEEETEYQQPKIDISGLPIKVQNWSDLEGKKLSWESSINEETKECYGTTYLFDHQFISACNITINSRNNSLFDISISGKNEDNEEFEYHGEAEFKGIRVGGSGKDTPEIIKERLAKVIVLSNLKECDFKLSGHCYESGVTMASMTFEPRKESDNKTVQTD